MGSIPLGRRAEHVLADFADALIAARPGHSYREGLSVFERVLFARALAATGGNQLKAAGLLGLNRNTLRQRCRELGLWPSPAADLPAPASPGAAEPRRGF